MKIKHIAFINCMLRAIDEQHRSCNHVVALNHLLDYVSEVIANPITTAS